MRAKSTIPHSSLKLPHFHFVITAGPTREHLDPVRFLSNPSTGKMGFAVAHAAAQRGHDVTLIAGPVALKTPKGVKRVDVTSAREMLAESLAALGLSTNCTNFHELEKTVFVSTAAVADWRPATCAVQKLKKGQMSGTLKLVRNPDILKTIGEKVKVKRKGQERKGKYTAVDLDLKPWPVHLVGFAAETNDVLAEASRKCREKGLSFIVANDVTKKGCGFGTDTNRVTFVFPDGTRRALPLMSKLAVARRIVRECEGLGL